MGREKRAALVAPFEIQPQATLDPLKLKPGTRNMRMGHGFQHRWLQEICKYPSKCHLGALTCFCESPDESFDRNDIGIQTIQTSAHSPSLGWHLRQGGGGRGGVVGVRPYEGCG